MRDPIVNQCCFCCDLQIGNRVFAILQILGSIWGAFAGLEKFNARITQADIDDFIKAGVSSTLIEMAKQIMNTPQCE